MEQKNIDELNKNFTIAKNEFDEMYVKFNSLKHEIETSKRNERIGQIISACIGAIIGSLFVYYYL
ncbi:MAG: hypothetical protein AABY32_01385 [Nanoarchaeota archaeon]